MNAFLNEASIPTAYSITQAREVFDSLKKSYQPARACGIREIKIKPSFYDHEFAAGYTFYNWADDKTVDEDFRTLLKSVIGTTPYADELFKNYEDHHDSSLAMDCRGTKILGLGLASDKLFNTVAISYRKNGWDDDVYEITINGLEEDESGKTIETISHGKSKNISTAEHVETHAEFINEQVSKSIANGKELWLKRVDLFPNLKFCDNVKSQLYAIGAGSIFLPVIVGRLYELQNVAAKLDGNPIQPEFFPSKTTPESNTRLTMDKDKLTIMCPDGKYFLFSWHSRYTPGAGRIHFRPYENDQILLIGSIANQNTIK